MLRDDVALVEQIARRIAQEEIAKAAPKDQPAAPEAPEPEKEKEPAPEPFTTFGEQMAAVMLKEIVNP